MSNIDFAKKMEVDPHRDLSHLENADPMEFPRIYDGIAGWFARLYMDYTEAPYQFLYCAALTCFGSLVSGRLKLVSELKIEPRLYTILLGQSGMARKSTALSFSTEFFQEIFAEFFTIWGVGSAEGLQKNLKCHPNLLLVFDEFKQFVSKARIDGSVLLPCVNTLYESTRYHNSTKMNEIRIEDAHLSILVASTIDTYESVFDNSFLNIGFPNRLFIVPGDSFPRFSLPAKIPESQKEQLKDYVKQVMNNIGSGLELDLMEDARKHYDTWYLNRENSYHSVRLDGLALRLMMLMAANEGKIVIDLETTRQAISVVDWELAMRKQYDPIDADSQMAKMEEKILRQLRQGPRTMRELRQRTNSHRAGASVLLMALENLKKADEIVRIKKDVWSLQEK